MAIIPDCITRGSVGHFTLSFSHQLFTRSIQAHTQTTFEHNSADYYCSGPRIRWRPTAVEVEKAWGQALRSLAGSKTNSVTLCSNRTPLLRPQYSMTIS